MTKQVQRRRGTSTQHTSFTGAEGEISVNTTNKSIHVHDGTTAGGVEAARADLANVSDTSLNNALSGNTLASLTITSADINGGTIDGTTIGGTSPAAVTGTTITATGDVTIPDKIIHAGDTNTAIRFPAADTVTVETSGAERLRVDSSGNVLVGTTSAPATASLLTLSAPANTLYGTFNAAGQTYSYLTMQTSGTDFGYIGPGALDLPATMSIVAAGARSLTLGTNGAERMRITSAGDVGIGATPTGFGRFEVTQATNKRILTSTAAAYGGNAFVGINDAGAEVAFGIAGSQLIFATGATERLRIDSSGNVGIGTSSPTAAKLVVTTGDTAQTAQFQGATGRVRVRGYQDATSGGIIDSTNTAENAYAPLTLQASTLRLLGNNATGITVDASGNVGIGTSSPYADTGYQALDIRGSTGAQIQLGTTSGREGEISSNATSGLTLNTINVTPIRFFTNGNERMRIDGSGNVGFGLTSPSYKVHASGYLASTAQGTTSLFGSDSTGTFVGNTSATAPVYFWTNGAERARIDSSGNLLVGTTSASCGGSTMRQHVSATDFVLGVTTAASGNTQAVRFAYGTTAVGSITLTGSATTYATTSDYRLKENVQPMQDALAVIAQLNPVTYTWKADGSDGQGFIAHELQAVVPNCVSGEKDAVDAEGNPQYQGVDTSFLVATLVKAVQELTARIAALEAAQ
jgi:hypothetical protein